MKYNLKDISAHALSDKFRVEQVEAIICYILEANKCTVDSQTMSTQSIQEKYQDLRSKHKNVIEIPQNSISTYASYLAKQSNSPIRCRGKKQGYYYDTTYNSDQPAIIDLQDFGNEYAEKDMYPLLIEWLSINLKDETFKRVADVSDKHVLEKWRNPDILGISKNTYFGTTYIELTTIEAKKSVKNWRSDIFEAVSHTLLANRAYFAYLSKESDKEENIEEMALYSQKFGIGILAIVVPDERWGKKLEFNQVTFKLIAPAALQLPPIKTQKNYLKGLKIFDHDSLETWGK